LLQYKISPPHKFTKFTKRIKAFLISHKGFPLI